MSSPKRCAGLLAAGGLLLASLAAPAAAPSSGAARPVHRVYPVADLIVPINPPGGTIEKQLIRLIQSSVCPRSWSAAGGPGSIDYYPVGMALVVCQTSAVHEEVAELLAALRRLHDVEVTAEIRFVTLSPETMDKLGLQNTAGAAVLDDTQTRLLLKAAGGDRRGSVTPLPKLTTFNGQKADLDLSEQQGFVTSVEMAQEGDKKVPRPRAKSVATGLRVSVLPVVSADHKTVTLQLGINVSRSDAPGAAAATPRHSDLCVEKTVKLADGATAVLTGWTRQRQARHEVTPLVLGKVPYLSRLFSTVSYGKEPEQVLVLVTPRVTVRPEEGPPAAATATPEEGAGGPQARVLYVNQRAFELSYQIDNCDPAVAHSVAVCWTRDSQDWQLYPEEVRVMGKVPIIARKDGRYGFTLVPRWNTEAGVAAPQPGERPQVWVVVDTKAPTLELSVPAAEDPQDEWATVAWSSEDEHPVGRPVSLYWALDREGPWHLLAGDLPARGRERFGPEGLPTRFYLRGEVVDRAGNRKEVILSEPVVKVYPKYVPVIRALEVRPFTGRGRW